jgi:hypothetical protein
MTETVTETVTVTPTGTDELFLSEADGYKEIKEFGEGNRILKYFGTSGDGASGSRMWLHEKNKFHLSE